MKRIRRRACTIAPLSVQQRLIWVNTEIFPHSTAYNLVSCMRIKGNWRSDAFRQALREVIRRHEILRTTFTAIDGEPQQIVNDNMDVAMEERECRSIPPDEWTRELQHATEREQQTQFDLKEGPLVRFVLLTMSDNERAILMAAHSIVMDGWSLGVFTNELFVLYDSLCNNLPSPLPEVNIQYSDYALWQEDERCKRTQEQECASDTDDYEGYVFGEFPADYSRETSVRRHESATQTMTISAELWRKINAFSREERSSSFVTMLVTLQVLLHEYSGQDRMLVGYITSGRNDNQVAELIGHFSTVGVVRARVSRNMKVAEIVDGVKKAVYGVAPHEEFIHAYVNSSHRNDGRVKSGRAFLPVVMNYFNFPSGSLKVRDLDMTIQHFATDAARFDMELQVCPLGSEAIVMAQYRTGIFAHDTVARVLNDYKDLLQHVVNNPGASISEAGNACRGKQQHTVRSVESKQTACENDDGGARQDGERSKKQWGDPASKVQDALYGIWAEALGVDGVSLDDNFIDIGGASISAMMILSRIKSRLNVSVSLRDFLDNPTIRQLANFIRQLAEDCAVKREDRIPKTNEDVDFPLSPAQLNRLRFELNMDVRKIPYLHSSAWFSIRLSGRIDRSALENAFNYVLDRHEVLRSAFWPRVGQMAPATNKWDAICHLCRINPDQLLHKVRFTQTIAPSAPMNVAYFDLTGHDDASKGSEINNIADEMLQGRYNYEVPPLTRAALIRTSGEEHVLIVAAAHLIADAYSMQIYEKELAHVYNALVNREPVRLPDKEIQYVDYVRWHERKLEDGSLDAAKLYWKRQLEGCVPTDATMLPFADIDNSDDDGFDLEAKLVFHPLSEEMQSRVRKYASSMNVTVFAVVMAGFVLCIYGETGKSDIGVYTFCANREIVDTQSIIGNFAAGTIVRMRLHPEEPFGDYVATVSKSLNDALMNQGVAMFSADTRVAKSLRDIVAYRPITCEWFGNNECASFEGVATERVMVGRSKSEYGLRTFVSESKGQVSLLFQYNLDLFASESIRRIGIRTEEILREMIENPSNPISSVLLQNANS